MPPFLFLWKIAEPSSSLSPKFTMPVLPATSRYSTICCKSYSTSSSALPNSDQLQLTPKSLLQNHPLYLSTQAKLPLHFKEKILCLEIMGVDAGKALSQNPSLHTATLESLHSVISFLKSKGIHEKDLPRIFAMCPQILTANIETDLIPVFDFLSRDLKVPYYRFRKVMNKCPRFLASSVRDQLKPALFYLQRLGFKDMEALAYNDPILLVSNVENTLIPKLKYLESVGFAKDETIGMVLRCPPLFTFSIDNNFMPKFEYFAGEMGRQLKELKEFPQYFTFSLDNRIRPRHMEAEQVGITLPLALLLRSTDEEFKNLIKARDGPL